VGSPFSLQIFTLGGICDMLRRQLITYTKSIVLIKRARKLLGCLLLESRWERVSLPGTVIKWVINAN